MTIGVQGFKALPEGYIFRRCEEICKETNVKNPICHIVSYVLNDSLLHVHQHGTKPSRTCDEESVIVSTIY